MLNDIMRENTVKDRLEELRMLSVSGDEMCVSGSFENKEVFWNPFTRSGDGKAKVEQEPVLNVSELEEDDMLIDLQKYIVVYAWSGYEGLTQHTYEWRYYREDENLGIVADIYYIRDGVNIGRGDHPEREKAWNNYHIMIQEYEVTQQKLRFKPIRLEEVRRYNDNTKKLWRFEHKYWREITPTMVRNV